VKRSHSGVSWRSVVLGLLLGGGLCALTPYSDYIVKNTYMAGSHLPIGAMAVLFLLALLNLVIYRVRGRALLHLREIAVVYVIAMVASGIPDLGLLGYLTPVLTICYYSASPGNRWAELFSGYIPPWMAVSDDTAFRGYYEGLPPGVPIPWGAWWLPMSRWFILIAAMWLMMICLAALVRRQWADRERLAFPLVQIVLEVLSDDEGGPSAGFFGNRLVWIGAGSVFLVHLINGLNKHFPALPTIPTYWNLDSYFVDRPWNAAVPIYVRIWPAVIGFGYLLPSHVAASFWFFVLFVKIESIVLALYGSEGNSWSGAIGKITQHEQMGGLLVLALALVWFLRGTLVDAFRKAFTRAPEVDDSLEPLGYRFVVFGLIASLGTAFAWLVTAGMTPLFAAGMLVVFVASLLVLTRVIAEAGILMVFLNFTPTDYLLLLGGTAALGARNLTVLTFVECPLAFDLRESLMPSALNGFRLAEQCGVRTRGLTPVIGAALIFCLLLTVPILLITLYRHTASPAERVWWLAGQPTNYFDRLAARLQSPEQPTGSDYASMLVGGAIVAALAWARSSFVWWPIHPLGFVMATSWASLHLWFSLFLGWLSKVLTTRSSGLRGFVKFRPFFMGLVMGDVLGAAFWITVGLFTKIGIWFIPD